MWSGKESIDVNEIKRTINSSLPDFVNPAFFPKKNKLEGLK